MVFKAIINESKFEICKFIVTVGRRNLVIFLLWQSRHGCCATKLKWLPMSTAAKRGARLRTLTSVAMVSRLWALLPQRC